MSSTFNSITWQVWSQKWGDWTTWFRKDVPLEPSPHAGTRLHTAPTNHSHPNLELRPQRPLVPHRERNEKSLRTTTGGTTPGVVEGY